MSFKITHCICHKIPFSQISTLLEKLTLDELVEAGVCGNACKLCIPYLREIEKKLENSEHKANIAE